jgi:uncharacterized protein
MVKNMEYIKRVIERSLRNYLNTFPVIGITGPRQSGKSTLLRNLFKEYKYVTFDDFQMRNFFYQDPKGFFAQYNNRTIFDEAQKAPELFELIKMEVDNHRQDYGKYILSGSSQFTLQKNIFESLAGRIGLLTLLPFQLAEIPQELRSEAVYRGSYPELVTRGYRAAEEWYSAYLDTYINKDLRDVANIGNLRDFQRFLHLLAINTAQICNLSSYAKEIGVSVPTIKSWFSVLEASYIVFSLPPYYENYGKRVVKSPKIYFYDTGLVAYLTGVQSREQFSQGPMCGALFENHVIAEVKKKILHQRTKENVGAEMFYFRTSGASGGGGEEVDLIVDYKTRRDFIEIKYSSTFNVNVFKPLLKLATAGARSGRGKDGGKDSSKDNGGVMAADRCLLLYNGDAFVKAENVRAMHCQDYLLEGIIE